jgi:hypothetical protein
MVAVVDGKVHHAGEVVAVALVVIAAALATLAAQAAATADFVRSLHLPGTPTPDTSALDRLVMAAIGEALIGVAIAAASLIHPSRVGFAATVLLSAFVFGTAFFALANNPELQAVFIGPLRISPLPTAVAIGLASLISIVAAAVAWLEGADESAYVKAGHMPPPTHQA